MRARIRLVVGLVAAGIVVGPLIGCGRPSTDAVSPGPSEPPSAAAVTPAISATEPTAASTPTPTVTSPTASSAAGSTLRFAIASDAHLGDAKAADPAQDFADLVAALNGTNAATPLDFVVLNGDLADHGGIADEKKAKAALAALTMPMLVTQGNHDRLTAEEWNAVWGAPTNQVLTYGEYSLILANTSNQAGDELCADKTWLAQALQETSGQRAVLVVMHVTPNTWTKFGVNCPDVRTLIAGAGNVRAVFNGHDHDQVGVKVSLGVRYFFDGHFGGHWGTAEKTFREVELSPNELTTTVRTLSGKELNRSSVTWK